MANFPVVATTSVGTTGATSVVTKPSSLATGDLMLALVSSSSISSASGTAAITPPASWTAMTQYSPNSNSVLNTFWKVADSSDAAASNFTFTGSSSSTADQITAAIARITGADTTTPIQTSNSGGAFSAGGSSTAASSSGVTPTGQQCLLVQCVIGSGAGSARTVSGYAVVNSNPSWTESFDINQHNAGDYGNLALAWANYNPSLGTATGNATATFSGGVTAQEMVILAIQPPKIAATTFSAAGVVGVVVSQIRTLTSALSAIASVGSPTISTTSTWTNSSKFTTTWTDTTKL